MREEHAEEEAEAAEVEAAGNAAALEVSLSLRISRELDEALKRRSVEEQVSPWRWFVGCFGRLWGLVVSRC